MYSLFVISILFYLNLLPFNYVLIYFDDSYLLKLLLQVCEVMYRLCNAAWAQIAYEKG